MTTTFLKLVILLLLSLIVILVCCHYGNTIVRVAPFSSTSYVQMHVLRPMMVQPSFRDVVLQMSNLDTAQKSLNIIIKRKDQKKLPDKEQNLPDKEQNFPDKEQNLPDKEQNLPDKEQNLPDKKETMLGREENLLDKEENLSNKRENLPDRGDRLPYQEENLPDRGDQLPDQEENWQDKEENEPGENLSDQVDTQLLKNDETFFLSLFSDKEDLPRRNPQILDIKNPLYDTKHLNISSIQNDLTSMKDVEQERELLDHTLERSGPSQNKGMWNNEIICIIAGRSHLTEHPCQIAVPLQSLPDDTSVVETDRLPRNQNYMPEIGNGHVATVVQSNAIYMNGLYNGEGTTSHRARIPSTAAVIATIVSPASGWQRKYRMDFGRGVFSEIYTAPDFTVELRRYAHRELSQLLVVELLVNRNALSRPITISFSVNSGGLSEDIHFQQEGPGMMSGKTIKAEYPDMAPTTPVTVVYSTVLPNMTFDSIIKADVVFFTCVSVVQSEAISCFNEAMKRMMDQTLFSSHVSTWNDLWNKGRIDLEGNTTLALITYASFYYLLSSLPLQQDANWQFCGLAPGGLAHGGSNKDYMGHMFWDQDTWMFPPIALLHIDLGHIIVETRFRTHNAALLYANATGYSGSRYPWESAFTGLNVSPSVETSVYEQHITGDVAWMMHQYLQLTNDTDFLSQEGGYQVMSDMADFWVSRVVYNSTEDHYEIRGVMGPDEWNSPVNNSAYINVIAAQTLYSAVDAALMLNKSVPPKWIDVASNMYVPFDAQRKYHPEFDNYKIGKNVKQADVILLGFPLLWPMTNEIRTNDLVYYATVTPSGPAMTWGMFAVNWLRVGNKTNADAVFYKGILNVQDPFKVWSENADGTGAMNFHTGMGGYLQSLLFGYAGFELNNQHLSFNLQLPPSLTRVSISGIDYVGNSVDISYDAHFMNVTLQNKGPSALHLFLIVDQITYSLQTGKTVTARCQPAQFL